MRKMIVSKDKLSCECVESPDEQYAQPTKKCIRCGAPVEGFDEFAPEYECNRHRRSTQYKQR